MIAPTVGLALLLALQAPAATQPKPDDKKPVERAAAVAAPDAEDAPVVTHHEVRAAGKTLKYTVTTGLMPIKGETGEVEARIFFMAYTLDGAPAAARRPLMFSFNGGPGSASVWLHLGAIGPRRVKMQEEGWLPPPPYQLVDNEYTWLDQTDLVFIDPVGTGYSRATKPEFEKKFWSLKGDIASVGEFIRLYLTRYERWPSPLFLVGESYGTTRAAGLSGYLVEQGVALNGVVLVSSILNFQTAEFAQGNDLPYVLYLPTYTATAWYHKKLPPDLQADLHKALAEAEQFASNEYTLALEKGDQLTGAARQAVLDKLARLTGLDKKFLDLADLRLELDRFDAELLRDERKTVGRLDARFTGVNERGVSENPDFDPSMTAIRPPYTAMFNNYVRAELGYKTDLTYYILGGGVKAWDFGSDNAYANVSDALRSAFAKNPFMKLFVASGYYDQATPYYATRYTLSHMRLDPAAKGNISTGFYEAGHMMYIDMKSLPQLKKDVSAFLSSALAAPAR